MSSSAPRALRKANTDFSIGNYMVEEEEVEARWEMMILARRGKEDVKEAAKNGDVGAKLEEGHLAAEKKRIGYERWGHGLG
jgi:hypothetical protein